MSSETGPPPGGTTTYGEPARPETLADRADFLTVGLRPISCRTCAVSVLVKKNSRKHTSIQWTSDATADCPVFADGVANGRHPALMDTCPNLSETIAAAADDGVWGGTDG